MDIDVVSLFKQGGIALVALVMLGWVIKRIGERMIGSIDKLTERHDTNAKAVTESLVSSATSITTSINRSSEATVQALGGLSERVARIEGMALREGFSEEPTPVEHPEARSRKPVTPAQGNPSQTYGLKSRPKTNG